MSTSGPIDGDSQRAGEIHLLDYLNVLAKHSRLLIYFSAAVVVIVYLFLFILPDTYKATARIMPPSQNLTLSGQILDALGGGNVTSAIAGGGMGGMAATFLGLNSPAEVYVGMLKSDTISDHIIQKFNLKKLYKAKYIEDARLILHKKAKIAPEKNRIINIAVTSVRPELSAAMANAYIDQLGQLLNRMSTKEAKGRLAFAEKERQQTGLNLNKAEEALRQFSEKNSVLQIDTQTKGALEYIARLRAEIDSKEVGVQVLRQQATPSNFDVVRMETEIKGLREKLRTAETKYDNCTSDVCLPTSKAPGLALEYIRLYREAKFQGELYQLFAKLTEIARLDIMRNDEVIHVVDYAKVPEIRSNKRLLPAVGIGMVTFLIMAFIVIGTEHIQNNEDNLQRLTKIKDSLRPWMDILAKDKDMSHLRKK